MLRVMIVDDSLIMRKNLREMLCELGHTVVAEAEDGEEALRLYREYMPQLVTMDISMPAMDGIECVRAIKNEFFDANIIMITTAGQEERVIESVKAGAIGYLLKPVTTEKLDRIINTVF